MAIFVVFFQFDEFFTPPFFDEVRDFCCFKSCVKKQNNNKTNKTKFVWKFLIGLADNVDGGLADNVEGGLADNVDGGLADNVDGGLADNVDNGRAKFMPFCD
jgi:hypothetical protein